MLRSSSELLGSAPTSELQALLSPYKSAACWRESPLLRSFEVKNSELWLQMGPVSAVCGELGLPSLERVCGVTQRGQPCRSFRLFARKGPEHENSRHGVGLVDLLVACELCLGLSAQQGTLKEQPLRPKLLQVRINSGCSEVHFHCKHTQTSHPSFIYPKFGNTINAMPCIGGRGRGLDSLGRVASSPHTALAWSHLQP